MMNTNSIHRSNGRFPLLLLFLLLILAACQQNSPPAGDSDTLKIEIAQDAVYRLPLRDLQKAGLAIDGLDYDNLSLTSEGTAVPYHIADEALIFYGQAATDRYQTTRPYLLHSGAAGVAMDETAVSNQAPSTDQVAVTLHLEENLEYKGEYRNDENADDLWFWQEVSVGQAVPINFELPEVADGSGTLSIAWHGITHDDSIENDHDIDLILNGQPLETVLWDGEMAFVSETAVPPNTLKKGENELILDNSGEGATFLDITALNWIDVEYASPLTAVDDKLTFSNTNGNITLDGFSEPPLIFDNKNPIAPALLTGTGDGFDVTDEMVITAVSNNGYAAPAAMSPLRKSNWRNADNAADLLLIITTDELAPALAPLVEAREAEGLAVSIAPVAVIYDTFGAGAQTPVAIQQFIAHAADNWDTPPRYVLLVGDATIDFRNYLGNAPANNVPSLMIPVGYSGETISDARLADTDGDGKPNMAIGRWPVDDEKAVEALIERTLNYEKAIANPRALFFTDGTEAQFASIGENLATESGLANAEHFNGVESEELTAVYNDGSWLTTYIGHGSIQRWGKEDIFYPEAVDGLDGQPPIVLQFTCLSGLFAHPTVTSLSEVMLLHDSGPIALVGATSLTLSSSQEPFAQALIEALQNEENGRVGDAFQAAKAGLDVSNSGLAEVSDTFGLLGDPSALIVRPE